MAEIPDYVPELSQLVGVRRMVADDGWVEPLHDAAKEHLGDDVQMFEPKYLRVNYLAGVELNWVAEGEDNASTMMESWEQALPSSFYYPSQAKAAGLRLHRVPGRPELSNIVAAFKAPDHMFSERQTVLDGLIWKGPRRETISDFGFRILLGVLLDFKRAHDAKLWLPSKLPKNYRLTRGNVIFK